MRQIIKQREVSTDSWTYADENPSADAAMPDAIIVPFARFQQERELWLASSAKLGVRLAPTDSVDALKDDLARISLVALEFASINDGRGYTHAQLLRRRYAFKGEIRAVGKIQRDQVFYMARCGIDAFEFPEGTDLNVALTGFGDFSVAYQPSSDQGVTLTKRAG